MDIHPGVRFILAARPIPNQQLCRVKVSGSTDSSALQSPLSGMEIQVLSKRDDHFVHLNRGVTDSYGTACLSVPCGCEHVISANGLTPAESQPLPESVLYATEGDTLVFDSPSGDLIRTGEGPVHLACTHSCDREHYEGFQFQFVTAGHLGSGALREGVVGGTLTVVEPTPLLPVSWYPQPEDSADRSACAVRLTIKVRRKKVL